MVNKLKECLREEFKEQCLQRGTAATAFKTAGAKNAVFFFQLPGFELNLDHRRGEDDPVCSESMQVFLGEAQLAELGLPSLAEIARGATERVRPWAVDNMYTDDDVSDVEVALHGHAPSHASASPPLPCPMRPCLFPAAEAREPLARKHLSVL